MSEFSIEPGEVIGYVVVAREKGEDFWQSGEELSSLKEIEAVLEEENVAEVATGFGDIVVAEVRVVRQVT